MGRVDILTGTLGKALGGASGGYTSGRREIIELLRQRSRPYLFSNSLAPPIVGASLKVLDLLDSTELRERLRDNTRVFPQKHDRAAASDLPGEHPIVPIMLGDAALAARMAKGCSKGRLRHRLFYPVVPQGKARIRVQLSAAHSRDDLILSLHSDAFSEVQAASSSNSWHLPNLDLTSCMQKKHGRLVLRAIHFQPEHKTSFNARSSSRVCKLRVWPASAGGSRGRSSLPLTFSANVG